MLGKVCSVRFAWSSSLGGVCLNGFAGSGYHLLEVQIYSGLDCMKYKLYLDKT